MKRNQEFQARLTWHPWVNAHLRWKSHWSKWPVLATIIQIIIKL